MSSRRSGRGGARPLRPFTVDHFRAYARNLVLDDGSYWEPEEFQLFVAEDLFAGEPEVWLVVPEENGKTTLMSGIGLYHGDYTPEAAVVVGASSRDQCEILHSQAAGFIRRTPGLEKRFRVFDGYRRIRCLRSGGRIQVFAADDRTGDGVIPTLALLDELHRHRDLRLYRTWRGKLGKRGGQLAAISTAGEPGSEFEEIRERVLKTAIGDRRADCYVRAAAGGLVLHDHAVPSGGDVEDMALVAQANPLQAITTERLAMKRGTPTMTLEHWKRFVCNVPTRVSGQAVTPEQWDSLCEEGLRPVEGCWRVAFLDLGWVHDTTGMGVLCWESLERRVVVGPKEIVPPKDGTVDEADVVRAMVAIQREYQPRLWVFDPNASGRQMVQLLDKGEHPQQGGVSFDFAEHSQDNTPMALAAARLDEAIRNGWLRHDGNDALRRHVLNAVKKSLGPNEKWRYDRPPDAKGRRRSKFPIDLLTGLAMANSHAVAEHESTSEPIVIWGAAR